MYKYGKALQEEGVIDKVKGAVNKVKSVGNMAQILGEGGANGAQAIKIVGDYKKLVKTNLKAAMDIAGAKEPFDIAKRLKQFGMTDEGLAQLIFGGNTILKTKEWEAIAYAQSPEVKDKKARNLILLTQLVQLMVLDKKVLKTGYDKFQAAMAGGPLYEKIAGNVLKRIQEKSGDIGQNDAEAEAEPETK